MIPSNRRKSDSRFAAIDAIAAASSCQHLSASVEYASGHVKALLGKLGVWFYVPIQGDGSQTPRFCRHRRYRRCIVMPALDLQASNTPAATSKHFWESWVSGFMFQSKVFRIKFITSGSGENKHTYVGGPLNGAGGRYYYRRRNDHTQLGRFMGIAARTSCRRLCGTGAARFQRARGWSQRPYKTGK